MNVKAYIESGILEEYVLGQLSEMEMESVRTVAASNDEVRQAIDEIEESLELFGQSIAMQPSEEVFSKAMEEIDSNFAQPLSQVQEEIYSNSNVVSFWKPLAMIASICLVLSLGANVYVLTEIEKDKRYMAEMQSKSDEVYSDLTNVMSEMKDMNKQMAIMQDPTRDILRLPGTEMDPDAMATVYYKPEDKSVYLGVNKLKEAPEDHQYQLWALDKNGNPVDMGVFDVNSKLQPMKVSPDSPIAFAVTLEVEGGSPTPTLDRMFVIGKMK